MSSTVVQDSDLSWTFTVSVNGTSSSIKHFLFYINSTKSIIVLKLYILRILMKFMQDQTQNSKDLKQAKKSDVGKKAWI